MCDHAETVVDTGRTFCVKCGIQRQCRVAQLEEPSFRLKDIMGDFAKQKYFAKALLVALGEEPISETEMAVLRSVASAAENALGRCAQKLLLKRFVLKRHRDVSAVVRKHFPRFLSLNGHPLAIVSSEQRRVMFGRYERAASTFDKSSFAKKKNISARDVIHECLQEFRECGLLQLTPPPR